MVKRSEPAYKKMPRHIFLGWKFLAFLALWGLALWLIIFVGPNMLDSGPTGWAVLVVCVVGLVISLVWASQAVWQIRQSNKRI